MNWKLCLFVLLIVLWTVLLYPTAPHPSVLNWEGSYENVISEQFGPLRSERGEVKLPNNVLVLMVEFKDVKFSETITNVDFLADPAYTIKDYISRFMEHLKSYYHDVSSGAYLINYTVFDQIISIPVEMSYFGDKKKGLERRVELSQKVIKQADPLIDFSQYDAYIIFHAGSGNETDIYGKDTHSLSSSFLNRSLLQYILDRDNDAFPGIATEDGVFIKELIISASHQYHPDNPKDVNYGSLGLLAHLFGRQIGLPALFGNVPDLGRAAGAGNFCLMGTGVWNANGFVPPFLSAWQRYFMGWTTVEEINSNSSNLNVAHPATLFLAKDVHKVYKINISSDEYYLIENRQQNPDGSKIGDEPSFTFKLLPEGEQDYYPPPYTMVPRFNFMKNSYLGCEWDFYLPGFGGPNIDELVDGSGILIWHIDERIIRENLESNTINADPRHQGVTLIEADGIQHLRSSTPDEYMRGSPYDSYRKGHNDYFGKRVKEDGSISLPYTQSYYGDLDLEIYNISESQATMRFSVRFPDYITVPYTESKPLPIAMIKGEGDERLLLQAYESGKVFLYKNKEILNGFPVDVGTIPHLFAMTEDERLVIIPTENASEGCSYFLISATGAMKGEQVFSGYKWASHPVITTIEHNTTGYVFGLNNTIDLSAKILLLDEGFHVFKEVEIPSKAIVSNLVVKEGEIFYFTQDESNTYEINKLILSTLETQVTLAELPSALRISSFTMSSVTKRIEGNKPTEDLFVVGDQNEIYLLNEKGKILSGFPVLLPDLIHSYPTMADIDGNGFLDILLLGKDKLCAISYNGELLTYPLAAEIPYPADIKGRLGVVALSQKNGINFHIMANLNGNRFVIWDDDFKIKSGYPHIFSQQNYGVPYLSSEDGEIYAYLTGDKGVIYRMRIGLESDFDLDEIWRHEFVNQQRTGFFEAKQLINKWESSSLFVKKECYVFPNPVGSYHGDTLYLSLMTNESILVEVKIFDITGKIIFQDTMPCQAYVKNKSKLVFDTKYLARGVYIAQMKAKNQVLTHKFAVEK